MAFNYSGTPLASGNVAAPSNTFGTAALRMLGIDPNSAQGQALAVHNQAGPLGQTNYSGLPNPGNGMSATGFMGGPGGPNGGAGPLPPTPPMNYMQKPAPYMLGPDSIDPASVGLQGGDIFGAGGAPGTSPLGSGTGGLSGLSGFTPDMMQQLMAQMQRYAGVGSGSNIAPVGPRMTGNIDPGFDMQPPRVDQFGQPTTDPTAANYGATAGGSLGMNYNTMPYQYPYQNPSQSPSSGFDYNNSQGDLYGTGNPGAPSGLTGLSQSLGNTPGRSSLFKLWNR